MRRFFIAGNWKMNKTGAEAVELAKALKDKVDGIDKVDIAICPPFTALVSTSEIIKNSNVQLGAQNVYWEDQGAFTGEISVPMLINAGCQYVIIGHSERRQFFGETNQTVGKKLQKVLDSTLNPIFCVGETLNERQSGITEKIVQQQITEALNGIPKENVSRITIAYEPVWAIGTGVTATPEQAQDVHAFIRNLLTDLYDSKAASEIRIQYGGSMNAANAEELLKKPDIDGGLIGGAALKADSFAEIIKTANSL
ncbi:triose-phosphate isomerase [candidate division KSB1 bacterium]|nr:triose-phosphate isomerase [candidate division KSB1 bacterium]